MSAAEERPVVTVFRNPFAESWHPFPWAFSIKWKGVEHNYGGIPNQCASKREASARAAWRAKWMREGTYDQHYRTAEPHP